MKNLKQGKMCGEQLSNELKHQDPNNAYLNRLAPTVGYQGSKNISKKQVFDNFLQLTMADHEIALDEKVAAMMVSGESGQ